MSPPPLEKRLLIKTTSNCRFYGGKKTVELQKNYKYKRFGRCICCEQKNKLKHVLKNTTTCANFTKNIQTWFPTKTNFWRKP